MSVTVAHWGRPRGALFVAGAIAVASAIGVLAVVSPVLAVAATVGGVAVPAAVLRPKLVVHLLVVSIYAEALAIERQRVDLLASGVLLRRSELASDPHAERFVDPVLFIAETLDGRRIQRFLPKGKATSN